MKKRTIRYYLSVEGLWWVPSNKRFRLSENIDNPAEFSSSRTFRSCSKANKYALALKRQGYKGLILERYIRTKSKIRVTTFSYE